MKSFVTEESLVNSELSDSGRALVDSDATTSMRTAQPQETIGLGRTGELGKDVTIIGL